MRLFPKVTTDEGEFCLLNSLKLDEVIIVLIHLEKIIGCCSTKGVIFVRFLHPLLLLHEFFHHVIYQLRLPEWIHLLIDQNV